MNLKSFIKNPGCYSDVIKILKTLIVLRHIKSLCRNNLWCISFDKVYGYIKEHGRDRYLSLIPLDEKYKQVFEITKNLIQQKVIFQMFVITTT